jgi:hypothetical protein
MNEDLNQDVNPLAEILKEMKNQAPTHITCDH